MPLIFQEKLEDGSVLGVWQITEMLDDLLSRVSLSQQELDKFVIRKTDEKKKQFLAARVLLYELAGKVHTICYHDSGRPYLKTDTVGLSLSHAGPYVAVVISPTANVGIDVERMPRPALLKAQAYFLSQTERAQLSADNLLVHLHLYWSAKEAIFKYVDHPSIDLKEAVYIHPFVSKSEEKGAITAKVKKLYEVEEVFLTYWLYDDYVLVVTGR